ncbi:hypothetical protein JQ614_35745 [Bradyrhizobium diazoefficiens]|uniref:hypothetical protein n=1 Tax=Bradyrhizobium diazoefficiens TaxID=1355477 RepID=UPI001B8D2178|nr:hypothetical protein [Bradyrhizobium diazoefficiens]MBR0866804.1 hypothetical protein [Bradyrhizobium diazoefficiens]MBR0891243.1 hypothetical protein [Bradyrhizobium diazoefficiens]MBR0923242.1 hypothetical protein [Bradyrhizobium diazoefficiens]
MKPMLREESAGQIRICPSHSEGEQSSSNTDGQQAEGGPTTEELVAELVKRGCAVTPALVGPNIASTLNASARRRSADAERKAREREEDEKKGWKQITVRAANTPMAREFLMAAAAKSKSPKILKALRAALDDPALVLIGRKVLGLKGNVGAEVRRALGL